MKDITIPVELKLHSDIRAKERAEFDYQVKDLAMVYYREMHVSVFSNDLNLNLHRNSTCLSVCQVTNTKSSAVWLHFFCGRFIVYQVAEKKSLIEQDKAERVRQQKVAEEEELRRLRKELIPKAQPMPYFDRPFVPRR